MKKLTLFGLAFFLMTHITSAQVLYSENFDNLTVGNVSTDITGQTPGQGGWYTRYNTSQHTGNQSWYQIQTEPNKGKVISLQGPPINMAALSGIYIKDVDVLFSNRSNNYNVIKLEVDFYTGTYDSNATTQDGIIFGFRSGVNPFTTSGISVFMFIPQTGELKIGHNNGASLFQASLRNNNQPLIVPFNTWVKCAVYLDYDNRKIYYEIPQYNIISVHDFLIYYTNADYFTKFTPKTLAAIITTTTTQLAYKFDNIKITALNIVPLNVSEFLDDKFNIFPNPATNIVHITNTDNILIDKILVYDVSGKLVKEEKYTAESKIILNIENFQNGTYFLHLETKDGTSIKKIIKQ